MAGTAPDPLALDGWLEFNRIKWGIRPLRLCYGPAEGGLPALEAVLFLNRRGRVWQPDRNPYIALAFQPTPTHSPPRLSRQWAELAGQLAAEMRHRGLANAVDLPPDVADARPWRWAGFRVGVKYTLQIDFPFDPARTDKALRQRIRKATREGYRTVRTTRLDDVHRCLMETERRKGFRHHLSLADLELARRLLGDEHFRCYLCYGPRGDPAAAGIVLHSPGGRALAWVGGTCEGHLSAGAAQALDLFSAGDLFAAGATALDLAGANIRTVADAKASFGASLRPYFSVEPYGLKPLAHWLRGWWYSRRQQGKPAAPRQEG